MLIDIVLYLELILQMEIKDDPNLAKVIESLKQNEEPSALNLFHRYKALLDKCIKDNPIIPPKLMKFVSSQVPGHKEQEIISNQFYGTFEKLDLISMDTEIKTKVITVGNIKKVV